MEISKNQFRLCSGFEEITIPSSVTRISYEACAGCNYLRSLTIPAAVQVIEEDAFKKCSGIERLDFLSKTGFEAFKAHLSISKADFEADHPDGMRLWSYLPQLKKVTVEGSDVKHFQHLLRPSLRARLRYRWLKKHRKKEFDEALERYLDEEGCSPDFYGPV